MDFSSFMADSHQVANVAGVSRMWKILAKSFTDNYPTMSDIVAGEVVASPTVRLPAYFIPAEYVVPFRTIGFDDSLIGEIGFMNFTHAIEFDFAGFSKESIAELLKDVNAGAVYVVELIDGQLAVLGTANRGLVLGAAGRSGKLGSDKRGKTLKAENNGYRWPVMPLSAAAKAAFLNRVNLQVLYPITADPYTVEAQEETIFTFEADGGNYTGTGDVAVIKYLDEQLTIPDNAFGPNGVQLGNITGAGESSEIIGGQQVINGYSLVVFFTDLGNWSYSGNFFKIIRL
jgi:hypothetical protein